MNTSHRFCHLLIAVLTFTAPVQAVELRLGVLFQDNMVLQREISAPVWGWADPGDNLTVSFAGQNLEVTAGEDGYWTVTFKGLEASNQGRVLAVSDGDQRIERKNVLVGEVWFSAGQSNMARSVGKDCMPYPLVAARIGDTEFPGIRYIRFGPEPSREPLPDRGVAKALWVPMTEESSLNSEAMPFFFGRHLHETLQVPVGLVQVAVSGTPQTAWTPREVFERMHREGISKSFEDWGGGKSNPEQPGKKEPSVLHNSQIHPFAPYGMRGMIWHQGEGGPRQEHAERMVEILKEWRELFGHDFIYLWGGLSRNPGKAPPMEPVASGKFYRLMGNRQFLDAQKIFGYDSNSAFVDFYDLGNSGTHWAEKDKAGIRFAKAALTLAYDRPQVYTGPQKIEGEIIAGKATFTLTHAGEGLIYKPSIDGISGFVFFDGTQGRWIEPRVEQPDKLIFEDPAIGPDTGIFYGWYANPHETLFNSAGLPASPFHLGKGSNTPDREIPEMLEFVKKGGGKAALNVLHVRRHVVTCAILPRQIRNPSTLRFLLPEEWNSVAVELNGKPVKVSPVQKNENGMRYVEFQAEANRWSYMIYDPEHEKEARAQVDLTRS